MLGADLTAIPTVGVETALTVAAEVGADLSRFATAAHFCSWLGLAPGTRISGDKRLGGGPPARQTNRVGQALRMAASTARNSKTAIGPAHRRRLSRMDSAKAVKATAHQLARLIYAMLTRGEQYVERDLATMETEPHGFRSSFRDWCGETGVEFDVSEKCLAHTVGNQVTQAYARSSLFNRRVKVMEDWAEYVAASAERDA